MALIFTSSSATRWIADLAGEEGRRGGRRRRGEKGRRGGRRRRGGRDQFSDMQ